MCGKRVLRCIIIVIAAVISASIMHVSLACCCEHLISPARCISFRNCCWELQRGECNQPGNGNCSSGRDAASPLLLTNRARAPLLSGAK